MFKDPAYITASRIICHSAIVILNELDKIPARYKSELVQRSVERLLIDFIIFWRGVLTPGFAFANTSLIKRLDMSGVQFRVLDSLDDEESKKCWYEVKKANL